MNNQLTDETKRVWAKTHIIERWHTPKGAEEVLENDPKLVYVTDRIAEGRFQLIGTYVRS